MCLRTCFWKSGLDSVNFCFHLAEWGQRNLWAESELGSPRCLYVACPECFHVSPWDHLKHQLLCHMSYVDFNVDRVEYDTPHSSEWEQIANGGRPVVNWSFMPEPEPCPHLKDSLFTKACLYTKMILTFHLSDFSYWFCEPKFLWRSWVW